MIGSIIGLTLLILFLTAGCFILAICEFDALFPDNPTITLIISIVTSTAFFAVMEYLFVIDSLLLVEAA